MARFGCIIAAAAGLALAAPALAADAPARAPAIPQLFSQLLPDVPGKRLVVVRLKLSPATGKASPGHRHPGSVWVYVTEGTARLGIEGQPVQVVHAGESFFEPPGALHVVAESASPTEPALAIAVMIVPDGAPLVLPPDAHAGHSGGGASP
jgi:quercetin dioxygenase-like cupin family protein